MIKFSSFKVLSAVLVPKNASPVALQRLGHRHAFSYDPQPGMLYVRSRAISSRTNDNWDAFPADEIKKAYRTFIGKPVFVNHNNDNHRRARGVVIDAALHEDTNPDGSPDTWVEALMEVDAVRFPKLAQAIVAGHIDRTSMGTDVKHSLCSVCGNKAQTPLEYCQHIPRMKGQRVYRMTASGKKEGILVREICHGLQFFENSLLVEEPADPTAFFTGVESAPGISARTAAKTEDEWHPDWMDEPVKQPTPCDCPGAKKIEPHPMDNHAEWAEKNHAAGKTDPWGHPLKKAYDGHGAWGCNNRECVEHPQSLYEPQQGAQGMPGWMQHENDPNKDLVREVGKAFHETGQQEDANWLLDQQHQGPSKYSSKDENVAPSTTDNPGRYEGVSIKKDKDGYYVHTHRARSDSYPSPEKIPDSKIEYIESTGAAKPRLIGHDLIHPINSPEDRFAERYTYCNRCFKNVDMDEDLPGYEHNEIRQGDPKLSQGIGVCSNCAKTIYNRLPREGSAKLAYGETIAPADVDTLRDEKCPVCGETDSYDGTKCQVCSFVAPPPMFQDPDLDVAKQNDLRQDIGEADGNVVDANQDGMPDAIPGSTTPGSEAIPLDPSQLNDQGEPAVDENGQPLPGADGQPIDPEQIAEQEETPDLVCPDCGYSTVSVPPESVDTTPEEVPQAPAPAEEEPVPGEEPEEAPAGPEEAQEGPVPAMEGDVCPQCQKATLVALSDFEDAGGEAAPGVPPQSPPIA